MSVRVGMFDFVYLEEQSRRHSAGLILHTYSANRAAEVALSLSLSELSFVANVGLGPGIESTSEGRPKVLHWHRWEVIALARRSLGSASFLLFFAVELSVVGPRPCSPAGAEGAGEP